MGSKGGVYYPILKKNSKETFVNQNYNDLFRQGSMLDNSISISGGDAKSNYFVSFNDLNQKGVARNSSDYRRTGVRINAGRQLNKWLNISNKASYILTNSNRLQAGINNAEIILVRQLIQDLIILYGLLIL